MKTLKNLLKITIPVLGLSLNNLESYGQKSNEKWNICSDTCIVYESTEFGSINIPLKNLREIYEVCKDTVFCFDLETYYTEYNRIAFWFDKLVNPPDPEDEKYYRVCLEYFRESLARKYIMNSKLFRKNNADFEEFLIKNKSLILK